MLFDDVNNLGSSITLNELTGPNSEGAYKDYADWGGAALFHVKSVMR